MALAVLRGATPTTRAGPLRRIEGDVGLQRAHEGELGSKGRKQGGVAVGAVQEASDEATRDPGGEEVKQLASELGLGEEGVAVEEAVLLGAVEAEEERESKAATVEGDRNKEGKDNPAVAKGEDLLAESGEDGVDVAADAKEVVAALASKGVVNDDLERGRREGKELKKEEMGEVVRGPGGAREEAVEALVVDEAREVGDDESRGDSVGVPGEGPADEEDHEVGKAGCREGRAEFFQKSKQCAKTDSGHRRAR